MTGYQATIINPPQNTSLSDSLNDSTDTQSIQGFGEENTALLEFPQNQAELNNLKQGITEKIDAKYEILKKNVSLHICYIYLLTYDYTNVIKTGNGILRNLNPNAQTKFQVLQYLGEAYCMLGQTQQAIECLKAEGAAGVDQETKFKVDNLSNGLREGSLVSSKVINLINISAVHMCAGQMDQAKAAFDQVLEALELKLQTTDTDSKNLLPDYLVNLLVYFYIKSKNYKMARQLLKSRRFLVDTNHIEAVNQGSVSVA